MKNVIIVDQSDFATAVLQKSASAPVLVDFWAPWCGPCRMLTPTLERLAQEFDGRFILAKVNTDQNQQLAMQYGVQGIPNVKAFRNGRVVDEFVGAQPEPMVRQFIQKLTANVSSQQTQKQAQSSGDGAKADPAARLRQAEQHLRQGRGCEAQSLLQGLNENRAQGLRPLADFLCRVSRGQNFGSQADLNVVYQQAVSAMQRREPSAALYHLLVALNQEQPAQKGKTKQVMESLFVLLGDQDPTVQQYKQQLATM